MRIQGNKIINILFTIIVIVTLNLAVIGYINFDFKNQLTLSFKACGQYDDVYQVFNSTDGNWNEKDCISIAYKVDKKAQKIKCEIPKYTNYIRIDLGEEVGEIYLKDVRLNYLWKHIDLSDKITNVDTYRSQISNIEKHEDQINITVDGNDPFIALDIREFNLASIYKIDDYINYICKFIILVVLNAIAIIIIKKHKKLVLLLQEYDASKRLIWKLAKNDFKTKYAGSYLGITWAFVQPIVTVLVYWFVFQVGFKSAPIEDFPFVLWLVAGMVPWFFYSEAVINASNSLIEYSYLVKKVLFKISILPVVKILSSLFVHIFFVGFTILLFAIYGYMPTAYMLQVVYYTLCIFVLALGLSYFTSAVQVFFRDLGQIINIFMQVGMWMTPIMWSYNMISESYQWILKINPMFYIVQGYRDSLIDKVWFWERATEMVCFWTLILTLFGIGCLVFKRLKVHFADVL